MSEQRAPLRGKRRRRRMVVAFVEVESSQMRMFRQAATGVTEPWEEPRHVEQHHRDRFGDWHPVYWCAADAPDADGKTFAIAPVYRTTRVPADAECETCGVSIRELQAMFGEATASA